MRPRSLTHDFPFCELFERIERSPIGEFMRGSHVTFPIFEIVHLIGLALFLGTLLLINLGLLGVGMRRQPAHQLASALAPWTWSGFGLLMITGPFMFSGQAAKWHDNALFWVKMFVLIIAIIFQFSVRGRITSVEDPLSSRAARLIGGTSLLLWISIGFMSKMMEFV